MMLDIQALQYMYGANFNTNDTDTTYSWDPNDGTMSINGVRQRTPGAGAPADELDDSQSRIPDDLGRQRPRHLRHVELRHRRVDRPAGPGSGRSPRRLSAPTSTGWMAASTRTAIA